VTVSARRNAPARGRIPFEDAVRRRVLENGAELLVLENHFNPTVAVSGSLHGGSLFAPAGKRLLASMTAGEMAKGTERRTKLEIAEDLESRGAAAYIEGLHMCMAARGAQKHEARVVTSAVHGCFRDQPATRQEFLDLVTAEHPSLV